MRKLTGYIGALIIVFALAGSVLAGYALNINGQSAVVNEYEPVTDVSGLYSYSDQKEYIDYNPASNYIGYSIENLTYDSDTGSYLMKKIDKEYTFAIGLTNGFYNINNNSFVGQITGNGTRPLFMTYNLMVDFTNNTCYVRGEYNNTYTGGWVTITADNNGYSIYKNDVLQYSKSYTGLKVVYTGNVNDYDYYGINGRYSVSASPDYNDYYCYVNNIDQILSYSIVSPRLGDTASTSPICTMGNKWLGEDRANGNTIINGVMTAPAMFTDITEVGNGVYRTNANFNDYTTNELGQPVVNRTITSYYVAYPSSSQNTDGIGVNYSQSNRVNNYPMVENPLDTSTQTTQLTLTNISASSVWPVNSNNFSLTDTIIYKKVVTNVNSPDRIFSPEWATPDYNNEIQNVNRNYRLSDILSTLSIPSNVKTITIDANGSDYFNVQFGPYEQYGYTGYTARIDKNLAGFTNIDEYQTNETLYYNDIYGEKDYIVYNTETGIASLYDYTGVKKSSNSPDKIAVGFVLNIGNNYTQATGYWYYNDQLYSYGAWNDLSNRPNPYLNITYTIINPGSISYMDITKGITIDSENISNVSWDNEYENGNIQLLFRAENTNNTYHNDLMISGNNISIDYTDSKYYITLNAGEPVDIGMWRNIILNADLVNGKLSVIPVRTFNSYTNVQLDKTSISIGDLIGAAPTNTIIWKPTNDSLRFNVYSTSVFMNTYGVVMFNPMMNITDYFTELDNFYELKLTNFSIFGDSITVNGETYLVDGNKLTVDDKTLIIKDLSIIYADGHAYLQDSHISIDIGEITDNVISMAGAWYFQTELLRGYTAQKMIYEWDWAGFIFDNTQFCIFYIGLAVAALLVARKFCQLSIIDYAVFLVSIVIALSVQVIA